MSSRIAHDLDNNKWRSEDITISLEDNEREENEMTFDSLNLKPNVLMGLKACGFARPAPIQLNCIPLGRCGLDLIVQSKSGTGKTCVFVVIALEMIETIESNATQVLIIGPTREIAVQIAEVVNGLSSKIPNLKCCTVIGGVQLKQDKDQLKKSHIVVGTPGRIKQLIELKILKTNSIRLLVLDECDKLLDNNFKRQIDDIYESLPQNKQMIVCSATMSTHLAQFLSKYMRTPAFVRLNADNPALIGVTQYLTVTHYHHLNHINFDNKIEPLIEIMQKIPFSQCLVFSNYQTRARMLCDKLNANNWPTTYISAEKCQTERLEALSKLKKYKCRVLVSTDLTARGIDVENVNLVINMDVPFDGETYLHRIGRAGRFGSRGIAITIASNGRELEQMQKIIKDCKLQVEELPKPIPENLWNSVQCLEGFSLDQSLNVSQTNESIDTNEEYNPFNRFTQRNDLSNESQKQWMSYNDIVNEYNIIKKSIENNTQSLLPLGRTDSQNALQQTNCDSIEKVFADKCLITTNDSDLELETQTLKFEIIDKCDQKREESETLSSDENDCQNESQYNLYENPVENGDNQKSFENNFSDMNHLIESGFNQWSTALFPPISNVSNPSQYNEWMNTNRHLWSYMINPFRSFELTQNVNQNSFNNNKRPLNKKQTES